MVVQYRSSFKIMTNPVVSCTFCLFTSSKKIPFLDVIQPLSPKAGSRPLEVSDALRTARSRPQWAGAGHERLMAHN